jgi:small subunit ribosomal protein S18
MAESESGAGFGFGRPPREGREGREGGFRGRGDRDRERGPMTAKARLRAKARKKARKAAKKRGAAGFGRKKVCRFCADQNARIEYRDPKTLRYFVTETGKLIPQRISGNCARHQRQVATGIKRARLLALMPFAASHV